MVNSFTYILDNYNLNARFLSAFSNQHKNFNRKSVLPQPQFFNQMTGALHDDQVGAISRR